MVQIMADKNIPIAIILGAMTASSHSNIIHITVNTYNQEMHAYFLKKIQSKYSTV